MAIREACERPVDAGRRTEEQSAPKLAGVRNYLRRRASRIRGDAAKARIDPAPSPKPAIRTGIAS
jgi:hypothetical protein